MTDSYAEDLHAEEAALESTEQDIILADTLRALQACADYIEAQGVAPDCLWQARAILDEAKGS
jgi:hypothetical protein